MKLGNKVKVLNLDHFVGTKSVDAEKRPKKLVGKTGKIVDINLGVFKVDFGNDLVDYFDGRELQLSEDLKKVPVDLVFVSWQRNGKSIFGSEEETEYFEGDFRRGVHFKGTIELDEEEIKRVKKGLDNEIRPVFDLHIIEGDRRKHRRDG